MVLIKDKKTFSLNEHVENFSNLQQFSNEELQKLICNKNYQPSFFHKIYSPNEQFPTSHIINELDFNKISICNCQTQIGSIYFNLMLKNPISNIDTLQLRQKTLYFFCKNYNPSFCSQLKNIQSNINECLWFFKENNEHSDYIYNMMFYNNSYTKFLNKMEPFLTISNIYKIIISPILTAVSPLLYILIPFVILRLMRLKLPFKFFLKLMWQQSSMISVPFVKNKALSTIIQWFSKFLSVYLYCQNVYGTYSTSKTTIQIVNFFQNKLEKIKELLSLGKIIKENYGDYVDENPKCFAQIENGSIYNGETSVFSNKGRILKDFYEFTENKEHLLNVLNNIGFIDYYLTVAGKLNEKNYYSIPKILMDKTPQLEIKGLWHPAVAKEKVVKNDIQFNHKKRNYILTGPNAAGKSTFIKSVFMNIYLAQTIGICNSNNMEYTPFAYLLTGIRNQDSQGSESLFEAEVHKIRDYLDVIKQKGENGFTFSILDEVFTSTNYQEGFAASKGLCHTIGSLKNSLHIVATHYTKLYKIVKEKDGAFRNIRFSVIIGENDEIQFPYKLEKGYSKQFIALKLMKQKHCDNVFLNNCLKYL